MLRLSVASLLAILVCTHIPPSRAADAPRDEPLPAQVRIESVQVLQSQAGPVVLLEARNRAIPIFIDAVVAESIAAALAGRRPVRPLTHDLMHDVLRAFDGRVTQVTVTLRERTYRGALTVVVGAESQVFDSRSSDAIALAIHFKAPIYVSRELLDSSGVELRKPDGIPL